MNPQSCVYKLSNNNPTYQQEMQSCLSLVGLVEEAAVELQDTAGRWSCLGPGSSTSGPLQKKTDIKRSQGERNIHMTCTKIYSTTWMFMCICKDSPSCSTGWMTCLCLRVWSSCSKIASKRAIFSSSVSGMTFTETPQKGFQNV